MLTAEVLTQHEVLQQDDLKEVRTAIQFSNLYFLPNL